MNNCISYSLFTPKQVNGHRHWDKHSSNLRYFYNIPANIFINSVAYPTWKQVFYLSKDLENTIFGELFIGAKEHLNIDVEFLELPYSNTEPTLWRYKPLIENSCDILLPRDIDSITTGPEIIAGNYFIQNDQFKFYTIRSHSNHSSEQTIVLAGLCGFKVREFDFEMTFNRFYEKQSNQGWGLDQDFLIGLFTNKPDWTSKHFLDVKIAGRDHVVQDPILPCMSMSIAHDDYATENQVFAHLNSLTDWSGEPVDIRGMKLKQLFNLNKDKAFALHAMINSSEPLREFYYG